MIIFSQKPTLHSRLANSLEWMAKLQSFVDSSGHECCFPWAIENFGNYLDSSSFWMLKNNIYTLFLNHTNQELSAKNISLISRKIEHDFEIKNNLKAFDWDNLITYSGEFKCLYISGNVDITDEKTLKLINKHGLVIIHEPFNLRHLNSQISKINYQKIIPKAELLSDQIQLIESLSLGKRRIGLHIRRGDYESWRGGKYFFDDDFWLAKVKDFIDLNYAVFTFTNETNVDFNIKLKTSGAHVSNEPFHIDFVRMMLMDDLYGPPSTFSGMAVSIARTCFGYESQLHYLPAQF